MVIYIKLPPDHHTWSFTPSCDHTITLSYLAGEEEEEDPNSELFEGLLDDDSNDADKDKGAAAASPGHPTKAARVTNSEDAAQPISSWEEMMARTEEEECGGASEMSSVQYDHLHQVQCALYLSLCALNEVVVGGGVGYIGILFVCILSGLVVFSEPHYVTKCGLWWCPLNHPL